MADGNIECTRTVKLQFHYIKGAAYREVFCNGVIGGVTPRGEIWMGLFAERGPIPRIVEFEVAATKDAESVQFNESESEPSRIEGREGIIRHVEVGAYMDIETAKRLHEWLGARLAEQEGKLRK